MIGRRSDFLADQNRRILGIDPKAEPEDLDLDSESWREWEERQGGKDKGASKGGPKPTKHDVTSEAEKQAWLAPVQPMPPDFKKLPPEQQDALANAAVSVPARIAELTTTEPWPQTGNLSADIKTRVGQCSNKLSAEGARMITGMATDISRRIVGQSSDSAQSRALAQQVTDYLVAQEIEAATRVLGDHGIHHLLGNDRTANEIMKAHGGFREEDEMAMTLAAVFHDAGYLTPPSRAWEDRGHERWGAQNFDANVAPMVGQVFGKDMAARVSSMIATHASTEMDWQKDPAMAAVRLADNVALFYQDKTPPLFRYVPKNREVMDKLSDGTITPDEAKTMLIANVEASSLNDGLKSQLSRAAGEVSKGLPKFIGGMWNGEIKSVEWDASNGSPTINITNKGSDSLMKSVDMGQMQFRKLVKTFYPEKEEDMPWAERVSVAKAVQTAETAFQQKNSRPMNDKERKDEAESAWTAMKLAEFKTTHVFALAKPGQKPVVTFKVSGKQLRAQWEKFFALVYGGGDDL